MTTGEKIYSLRKEARITQEEFAEKLEVSRQAVSKWESDLSYPESGVEPEELIISFLLLRSKAENILLINFINHLN